MQCNECGESAKDITLRYCENCGAKMPMPPPGTTRTTGTRRSLTTTGRPRVVPARLPPHDDDTEEQSVSPHVARPADRDEQTDPGLPAAPARPAAPAYDGPVWLAHVPGHSPTVLGLGLVGLAIFLSILPFFSGVGPLWTLLVLVGGGLLTVRELRAAGLSHPALDWVPAPWLGPLLPALVTVLLVALAVRMLSLGLTPLLWLGGAGLVAHDQYRKVYVGEQGFSHFFEPRQLLRGPSLVALVGVGVCLLALFLTWTPSTPPRRAVSSGAPSQLRMMDPPPGVSSYELPNSAGWDQSPAVVLELLLLGVLALLALHPEEPRPSWLRLAPVGVVAVGTIWVLVSLLTQGLAVGPFVFLGGLVAVGVVSVRELLAAR
jgi:hypothetical protein